MTGLDDHRSTEETTEMSISQEAVIVEEVMPHGQGQASLMLGEETRREVMQEAPAEVEPVAEPILFSPTRRPPPLLVGAPSMPISPAVMLEILNFKNVAAGMDPPIVGVQFQCRAETDADEISHHGHVVYDTRYLDDRDHRIYIGMNNQEMWNRIMTSRVRLHRTTTEEGPMDGMYYWNVATDRVTRLSDAGPETGGALLDDPELMVVVGG